MVPTAEIYLDNNASAPPLPPVIETVISAMRQDFGNPSAIHRRGALARRRLAAAREAVAALLGADPAQVFFNSGGTEGNNTVLSSVIQQRTAERVVTTPVEHDSVLRPAQGLSDTGTQLVHLSIDSAGRILWPKLHEALANPSPTLLSVQWVNGETGVIQPIDEIAAIAHARGALFHVDAAQAVGRLPIDLGAIHVDYLTLSGHKLHGPLGTGVVYVREPRRFVRILHGGGQEGGHRSGTENLPGILGLACACDLRRFTLAEAVAHIGALRDHFEDAVRSSIPNVRVNGSDAPRVCNTSNICFAGVDGQALLAHLDRAGILCSQASACSSRRPEPSHVLRAMGLSEEEAFSSLRFSLSILNTLAEVDRAVETVEGVVQRLRNLPSFARS